MITSYLFLAAFYVLGLFAFDLAVRNESGLTRFVVIMWWPVILCGAGVVGIITWIRGIFHARSN